MFIGRSLWPRFVLMCGIIWGSCPFRTRRDAPSGMKPCAAESSVAGAQRPLPRREDVSTALTRAGRADKFQIFMGIG